MRTITLIIIHLQCHAGGKIPLSAEACRQDHIRHRDSVTSITFTKNLKNQTTMSDVANKTNHIGDDVTFYPSYLCTHCIA